MCRAGVAEMIPGRVAARAAQRTWEVGDPGAEMPLTERVAAGGGAEGCPWGSEGSLARGLAAKGSACTTTHRDTVECARQAWAGVSMQLRR